MVVPPPSYDSQSATGDVPPSQTLSVVVTETWSKSGVTKSFSSTTQISSAATGLPQIVSRFRDSPLSVDTAVDDAAVPTTLQLDLGLLNATAGLSTGATATAQAQGALAVLSSGAASTTQATGYLDAPADQPSFTTVNGAASNGPVCSALLACFGPTRVSGVTGSASNGVPQVGSSAAPLTSSVVRSGTPGSRGFWVSNVPTGSTQSRLVRLGVQSASSPPTSASPTQLLRSVETGASGSTAGCAAAGTTDSSAGFATATGWIGTTAGPTHAVTSCATATTRRVDLFPLAGASGFNADGVVQIVLQYAGVNCAANAGVTGAASAVFRGTVSYLPYGSSTPTVLTVASGQASDPLTPALLTKGTSTGGVQIGVDPSGKPLWLGDYVRSWSSGDLARTQVVQSAQVDLKAIALSTVPTRDSDGTGASGINLVAGQLSCTAQDNR